MILFYCTRDQVRVSSISVNFCWSYALLECRKLKIHSFPHFILTGFDILSWNFAFDFYCTRDQVWVSSIFVELCPFWNLEYWNTQFSALFSYMLWYIKLKFCIWLSFTVLQTKFQCCQFPSIFVGVMPLLELRMLKIGFRTFLLHALTYWTAILHMTLFDVL